MPLKKLSAQASFIVNCKYFRANWNSKRTVRRNWIRQIEEMEVSRLARESEIETNGRDESRTLTLVGNRSTKRTYQSSRNFKKSFKAQEEITSEQRGKIWDRDGRLEDAAETLKATTEKLTEPHRAFGTPR